MIERIPALPRERTGTRRRGGKLLWIVVALFVAVLIVLFFRSSLSRISVIEIQGLSYLKRDQVEAQLGVGIGDSFFMPASDKLAQRVKRLPQIKDVRVAKHFPGKLKVAVQEYEPVAIEMDGKGGVAVVLANGIGAQPAAGSALPAKPVLTGWSKDDPERAALCRALGGLPAGGIADFSEISPDPSSAYPDRIRIFTRSGFDVLTTVGKLKDKITILGELVENREPGTVVLLDSDTYSPYSAQTDPSVDEEAP
ncbi:cell division protein FtsQ/DivIB [Cohnella rhizosphaerae]|uniref:FtsQ-type POTRA domain-containing protein n=1 Tax=Cohnella rhizosphaerae TaxID=1457232 RepID=A0A9X4QV97_9BACL|nr:FtsQ-type POTRA domain-containing protein [Cohnella rhizosphaerae]MDG0812203.1 FtsQ-type POTRA domain-containing protein [Cohnella rhizosphaerae]